MYTNVHIYIFDGMYVLVDALFFGYPVGFKILYVCMYVCVIGMLVIKLPHFTIPLMIRKSDGGYGYDSTDMAALKYRIHTLQRDWIVIITDAGQVYFLV